MSCVVNVAEPTGSTEGEVLVLTCDWQSFLGSFFKKFKGIKKLHHSRFESDSPGVGFAIEKSDSVETELSLMKTSHQPLTTEMPQQLAPSGLSLQCQWYLYQKIREFYPDEMQDITCPLPTVTLNTHLQRSHSNSPAPCLFIVTEKLQTNLSQGEVDCAVYATNEDTISRTCPEK